VMSAAAPRYSKMESGIRKLDNLLAFNTVGAAARIQSIMAAILDAIASGIRSFTISQVIVALMWQRCVQLWRLRLRASSDQFTARREWQLTGAHFWGSNDGSWPVASRTGRYLAATPAAQIDRCNRDNLAGCRQCANLTLTRRSPVTA
jgi:hypothetical protein